MPVSLTPHYLFDRYDQIDPGWLSRQGITLLLSDLDFTLAPKSVRRPTEPCGTGSPPWRRRGSTS
jgi:predicted HAD superfamily phosphohydrolase YqeG